MNERKPLVAGSTTLEAALELSAATAALTHTGATGLAITSTSGYVDVEDVRFTGAVIGVGATTVLTLAAAGRGSHSFLFPLNLSLLCPFPLNLIQINPRMCPRDAHVEL